MSNMNLKPWTEENAVSLNPNEILFSVLYTGGSYPYIIMVPEYHFEMSGKLYGKSMKISGIDSLNEYGFKEKSPSTFEIDDPSKITDFVDELRNLGFKESESFSNFIKNPKENKEHVCSDDCSHHETQEQTKMDILNENLNKLRKELRSNLLEGDSLNKSKLDFEMKEFYDKANVMVEEVMGFSIDDLKSLLGKYVDEHAEKLCNDIEYLAENNNFDKGYYDEKPKMIKSMRRGATTADAWKLASFGNAPNIAEHLYFTFSCDFLNGGEDFKGVVCVDNNGKIKHHFVHKTVG